MDKMTDINRRDFLKKIGILSGAAVAAAEIPWLKVFTDKSGGKSAGNKVRLAVIGAGDRGTVLLKNIQAFQEFLNVEIAAICDNYPPNYDRALMLTKNKARGYYNYRELIGDRSIDGVVIATPVAEHANIAIEAMEAGLHVFCEKAMARTLDDTKNMFDAYKRTGKILQIGHQRVFSPVYINAIEKIRDGKLGQITHIRGYWHRHGDWRRPVPANRPDLERVINWRLYDDLSAGLFTELLSHQMQVANWVKNDFPVSVTASGSLIYYTKGREVHDHISCIFNYPGGSMFLYDSINSNRHYGCEEQIIGSKGTMELEVNKIYSETPPPPKAIVRLINDMEKEIYNVVPIGGASWVPETAQINKGLCISDDNKMDETKLQLEAFVRYIRNGCAPEELLIQGYYSTIWSLLAEKAAKTGQRELLDSKYKI